jgi:hypothetical protein
VNDSKLTDIDLAEAGSQITESKRAIEELGCVHVDKIYDESVYKFKIVPQEPTPAIKKRDVAIYRRGGKTVQLAALLAASLGSSGAAAFNQLFDGVVDTEFPKYKEKTLEDIARLAKAEQKRARKMARRKS